MSELHNYLRDLDDLDDFSPDRAAPFVYGFDTRDFAKVLPEMIERVRAALDSPATPLGRSAAAWVESGNSRVPGATHTQCVSAAAASAKTLLRSPSSSLDSLDSGGSGSGSDGTGNTEESTDRAAPAVTMAAKTALSLFLHEVAKLALHAKDVSALYCKMKEELVALSPRDVLSLAYHNAVATLFRNADVFDNARNARRGAFLYETSENEQCAAQYEARADDAVRRFLAFQDKHATDLLNDLFLFRPNATANTEPNGSISVASFERFVDTHALLGKLYGEVFSATSSAKQRVDLSRAFFFSWMWNAKIVLNSLHRQRRCLLPATPFSNGSNGSTVGTNRSTFDGSNGSPVKQAARPAAPTSTSTAQDATSLSVHSELDGAFVNARQLLSLALFCNMNATRAMKNGRERDALLSHYHGHHRPNGPVPLNATSVNTTNGSPNGSVTTTNGSPNGSIPSGNGSPNGSAAPAAAQYLHARFSRSYTSTVLWETETISVRETPAVCGAHNALSHSLPSTTQYERTLELRFDERRKKNDLNTSVFSDETNAYMSLCQRFQRENVPIGLLRNVLTSKRLSLSYYTTSEHVAQGLFSLFLVEVVRNPSALLIHAMALDLIEGAAPNATALNSGTASTASSRPPSPRNYGPSTPSGQGAVSRFSLSPAGPSGGFSRSRAPSLSLSVNSGSSVSGSVAGLNGSSNGSNAGPWSWTKLVPTRRRVEPVALPLGLSASAKTPRTPRVSLDGSALLGGSANKTQSMHTSSAMRDFLIDDVLLPAAVEGAPDGQRALLSLYNSFSPMPYHFDDSSLSPALAHAPLSSPNAVDVKWLLLDKEFHILASWLHFRTGGLITTPAHNGGVSVPGAVDLSQIISERDPQRVSAWLLKTLLPRLVELMTRWYNVNLWETFEHLRPSS